MTEPRLLYETRAGNLSAEETFAQLLENLRLAEEDARALARLAFGRAATGRGQTWTHFANKFSLIQDVVRVLATSKANPSSVGYTENG